MQRLVFTFYFLFSTFLLFSQEQFNTIYDNGFVDIFPRNVFQTADTGYVQLGATVINGKMNILISFTDEFGDFKFNKTYGNANYNVYDGAENSCVKTEGGYILAASRGQMSVGDTCFIYVVKFDEQFDTLWTRKHFVDTNWVVSRGICNTDDGGFMIVGETKLTNDSVVGSDYQYALMLKLDANGNYEWFKSFGTDFHNDNFYKVVQTHDGGYLVGGGTDSWQESLEWKDQGDWYIVKTDSQGNEEWHRRYGNPILREGRVTEIVKAIDSTYYLTGAWTYHSNSTGSDLWKEAHVIKLDQNFDEVFSLKYDNQAYWRSYPMAAIETNDSNIVLIGRKYTDYAAGRTTIHKINPQGEILWQRQYVAGGDTTWSYSDSYSVKQTSDNGFIIGGVMNNDNFTPDQQMWLVKTDSMGCDGTGDFMDDCTNVMLNEFVNNPSFEMYPNPARDNLFITCHFDRSGEISSQTVEIYNIAGRLVKSTSLRGTKQSLQISDLEKGVYIVKAGKQTKKLIIE